MPLERFDITLLCSVLADIKNIARNRHGVNGAGVRCLLIPLQRVGEVILQREVLSYPNHRHWVEFACALRSSVVLGDSGYLHHCRRFIMVVKLSKPFVHGGFVRIRASAASLYMLFEILLNAVSDSLYCVAKTFYRR